MNNGNNNRIRIKTINVLFAGQYAVGKSCLIQNYFGHKLNDDYFYYSYLDTPTKNIKDDDSEYRIRIFDFPGTERFMSTISSYLRYSKVVVLVFDMTRKESFLYLDRILELIYEERDINEYMFVLIGNKADVRDKWEIKESDAKKFADIIHAKFLLTSAKNEPKILQEFLDKAFIDYIRLYNAGLNGQPNQRRQQNIILNRGNRRRRRGLCS